MELQPIATNSYVLEMPLAAAHTSALSAGHAQLCKAGSVVVTCGGTRASVQRSKQPQKSGWFAITARVPTTYMYDTWARLFSCNNYLCGFIDYVIYFPKVQGRESSDGVSSSVEKK